VLRGDTVRIAAAASRALLGERRVVDRISAEGLGAAACAGAFFAYDRTGHRDPRGREGRLSFLYSLRELPRHRLPRPDRHIYELLIMDETLRAALREDVRAGLRSRLAIEIGMRLLKDDGIRQIRAGVTTAEEVLRVANV
jgi:hypothetical protein